LKSAVGYEVGGINLWQINTKNAAEGTLGEEPAQESKTVIFKTGLAANDGKQKSLGAYTRNDKGPILLVTGVKKVK
jgi:hypothetical protein